jgi:hypothetical protein
MLCGCNGDGWSEERVVSRDSLGQSTFSVIQRKSFIGETRQNTLSWFVRMNLENNLHLGQSNL